MVEETQSIIVRPGDKPTIQDKNVSWNPDIMRQSGILKMMDGPATLCRVTKEQMIFEGLLDACVVLGMRLPASKQLAVSTRDLSPGLDGLGRGEAVKCLITSQGPTYYPSAPFGAENKPGIISRLMAFFSGKKAEGESS